mmetsp:Transcript_776/g.2100  ORF Transcript_776/g.2100 Transcript_776/m.2100 type:complete len:99 (-) Transcript_776:652-948(-)
MMHQSYPADRPEFFLRFRNGLPGRSVYFSAADRTSRMLDNPRQVKSTENIVQLRSFGITERTSTAQNKCIKANHKSALRQRVSTKFTNRLCSVECHRK